MRWERLFADLEGQLAAAAAVDLAAEVADRVRGEWADVRLVDRLRPLVGAPVRVSVAGAGVVEGRLAVVGSGWLLLGDAAGDAETVVAAGAVVWVEGLARATAVPGSEGEVARRLGLGHVLRGVCRDRSPVVVVLCDGQTLTGTVDRVGADFVEVAVHPLDEPRRADRVRGVRAVPFSALAMLRRVVG